MARKVDIRKLKQAQAPTPTTGQGGFEIPPPPQARGVESKPQDFLAMWAMFMVVFGIGMVAHKALIGAVAGAIVGGALGQVLPVNDEGKRLPMPATVGMIGVGLVLVMIGILMGGKM